MKILGLRTTIYHVPDLARARAWYSKAFNAKPYFDEPFYVGFNVGGYELGLDPDVSKVKAGAGGSVAYWGVDDIDGALKQFTKNGAKARGDIQDVGEGIRVVTVEDPFGNLIGLIRNPHFKAE